MTPDALIEEVKSSLANSLDLGDRISSFTVESKLLGELPELDSMAVLTVVFGLEEHFGISVDDDDISAETFETVGGLADLVRSKLE